MSAIFEIEAAQANMPLRFGCVTGAFLADCEPEVLDAIALWENKLTSAGGVIEKFEPQGWEQGAGIFSAIQAHEAAALHRGNYDVFEPAIADRLRRGAEITDEQVAELRARMSDFSEVVSALFQRFDFLMLPCAPVRRLYAGEDHGGTRPRILKYTTPFSLAGLPTLALPGEIVRGPLGSGVQIAAKPGHDSKLLGLAHAVGNLLASG